MAKEHAVPGAVLVFRLYPAKAGDRLTLLDGPWRGDWEVVEVGERKLRLRCPVTRIEIERERFFYFLEAREGEPWPHPHE